MTDFVALKAAVDNHLVQATYWKSTAKLGKGYGVAYSTEANALRGYIDALASGKTPALPVMNTEHGKGLLGMIQASLTITPAPIPDPTPTPTTMPYKGISPGYDIQYVADGLSWELPEIVACVGKGQVIRLDTGNDAVLDTALADGLSVWLVVGGTIPSSTTPSAHAALAAQYASRYKGRLLGLELGGNEPNLNGQNPQGNANLINAAVTAIRAVDSNVPVGAGSLGPGPNFLTFATSLIPLITPGTIQHFVPHLYDNAAERGSWNGWDRTFHPESLGGALTVRQLLDKYGHKAVYISSGESGCRVTGSLTEATQNLYVTNAYNDFAARRAAGELVQFIAIYCMRNNAKDNPYWGLTDDNKVRRPAWYEVHTATA